MDNEVVRAIAVRHDGAAVDWYLAFPLHMARDVQVICDAVDEFLLDQPGCRVTITVERPATPDTIEGIS